MKMNKVFYLISMTLILLSTNIWAKGGDDRNPKKDGRIIRKQLKKNLKKAEANYVFDRRGEYYNTSFIASENETKFNAVAANFLDVTGYQVSFINVQDYLKNGTETEADLESVNDNYIRGLEKNIPANGVYFLLIPQTDVGLTDKLETQFSLNVLIGAEVDINALNDYLESLGVEVDENGVVSFIDLIQIALLSQKFNDANLAINNVISFLQGTFIIEYRYNTYGRKDFYRYFQVLYYQGKIGFPDDLAGMECNACCTMYFLQSYGLIPPNTSRRYFEHLFTSLPTKLHDFTLIDEVDGGTLQKNMDLEVDFGNGVILKPQILIYDELFIRGKGGNSISPINGGSRLYNICKRFYDYRDESGNQPLKQFHDEAACSELFANNGANLVNIYNELTIGLDASYFEKHVVFVGIHYYEEYDGEAPGHYCVIVDKPREETEEGVDFWVYPADDPKEGKTEVYVPKKGELIPKPYDFSYNNFLYAPKNEVVMIEKGVWPPIVKVNIQKRLIVNVNAIGVKPN